MKQLLTTALILCSFSELIAQDVRTTVMNDSTELQQYADGQSLKVRYLLNGRVISLKDKENLLATGNYVRQEFNIKTEGKEVIGEINLLLDDAVQAKAAEAGPAIVPPHSINIFSNLDGVSFPEFKWKDLEGNSYSLADLKGKVVVFNFWHTTCGPCIAEMPLLNKLVKQYAGKDVVFIASTPNDESQAKKFFQKNRFDYEQVVAIDPKSIFDPFPGWPIHIVLDKNGLIRFHVLGKQQNIEQKLAEIIDASLTGTQ